MAPTLALHYLSLVLFFFMSGEGISARDLKIELRDQKHDGLNWDRTSNGAHKVSQPNYLYKANQDVKQSNYLYKASEEVYQPNYLYKEEDEIKQPNYLYKASDEAYKVSQPNYLYKANQDVKQSNYLYKASKEVNQPNYLYKEGDETKQPNYLYKVSDEAKQPNYLYKASDEAKHPSYLYKGSDEVKQHNYLYKISDETKQPNYLYTTSDEVKEHNYLYKDGDKTKQPNYLYKVRDEEKKLKGPPSTNSKDRVENPSPNLDHTEAFEMGFFNPDDLYVGNVMTLQFPVQEVSNFLSRKDADSIPLSISQLPSILQLFSIPEDSPQAKSMRGTLEQCKGETVIGETNYCANSVESMHEFVDTIIGSEVEHNILTTSNPSPSAVPLQKYTILKVSHDIDAPKWVSCHPLTYPYAIYYCHYIATGAKVFKVSLVGDNNGDKMEALGMCHLDTFGWDPNHIMFKTLRIKPGKNSPVCHFFPINHLLWVPMQSSKAVV